MADDTPVQVENWRNAGLGEHSIIRIGPDGRETFDNVEGHGQFTVTVPERELNTRRSRPRYDPFTNGQFEKLVSGPLRPDQIRRLSGPGIVGGASPLQLPAGAKERRDALQAEMDRLADLPDDAVVTGPGGSATTLEPGERYETPEGVLSTDELSEIVNLKVQEFKDKVDTIDSPITMDRLLQVAMEQGATESKKKYLRQRIGALTAKGIRNSGPTGEKAILSDAGVLDSGAAAAGAPPPALPVGGGEFGEGDVYAYEASTGLGIKTT